MGEDEEDPFALPPMPESLIEAGGDPMAWLQEFSAEDDEATPETEEPAAEVEIPAWLEDSEPETPADEPLPDDAPPWLQAIDTPEQPMVEETGKLSAEWLSGAENAPEAAENDMTFDEWQQIQDEVTRPHDIDEEMPDLFAELGGELSSDDLPTSETGELPSWVLGMDELDTSDAPEWFTGDEGEETPAEPEPTAAPPAPPDDIFGELGLPPVETGYDFLDNPQPDETGEDWFGEEEQAACCTGNP